MRAGIGYDVHRLTAGRPLVLGGIRVPFDRGLEGHSDADVLVHAIVDAMLGALALGDIGQHFPDSDPRWKDASSLVFLEHARKLLAERGYRVVNVDAVILAQRPKLAAFLPQMAEQIARTLYLETGEVSVKATTTEGLGFVGREEGMAAQAVVLIAREERTRRE